MSFAQALSENPVPRRLGNVRLRFDGGRLVGESLPPSFARRLLPGLALGLAAFCALGSLLLLVARPSEPGPPLALGVVSAACVGWALHLEGRLGRHRFVLLFHGESLRLETLRWAPGASRTEQVPFDAVTAVEVVEKAPGLYSLVVRWRGGEARDAEAAEARSAVLVDWVHRAEEEALFRVWRMLHNAFGLRGAGLA
ncbi:hypothetical protein P2318_22480 [Myxococcaceae bacterium GXIMD 01537]